MRFLVRAVLNILFICLCGQVVIHARTPLFQDSATKVDVQAYVDAPLEQTNKHGCIFIVNQGTQAISFDAIYEIERWENEKWSALKYAQQEPRIWDTFSITLQPGEKGALGFTLLQNDYTTPLDPGQYRISKKIFIQSTKATRSAQIITAEFEIVKPDTPISLQQENSKWSTKADPFYCYLAQNMHTKDNFAGLSKNEKNQTIDLFVLEIEPAKKLVQKYLKRFNTSIDVRYFKTAYSYKDLLKVQEQIGNIPSLHEQPSALSSIAVSTHALARIDLFLLRDTDDLFAFLRASPYRDALAIWNVQNLLSVS